MSAKESEYLRHVAPDLLRAIRRALQELGGELPAAVPRGTPPAEAAAAD